MTKPGFALALSYQALADNWEVEAAVETNIREFLTRLEPWPPKLEFKDRVRSQKQALAGKNALTILVDGFKICLP